MEKDLGHQGKKRRREENDHERKGKWLDFMTSIKMNSRVGRRKEGNE